MIRDDVCYLIQETPGTHGVFDTPTRTERMVYCSVRSVSSADFWRAYSNGLEPTLVFVLSDFIDYQGERLIRYGEGQSARYYKVLRTYAKDRELEITVVEAGAYDGDPQGSA